MDSKATLVLLLFVSCLAAVLTEMPIMVEASRYEDEETTYNAMLCTVRVSGISDKEKNIYTGQVSTIRSWAFEERNALCSELRLENGAIVINKSGLYTIYSLANFIIASQDDEKCAHFQHAIIRYNARLGVPDLISKRLNNQCLKSDSSYLSAMETLYAGDSIYVQVSNKKHLINKKESMYLGIHCL